MAWFLRCLFLVFLVPVALAMNSELSCQERIGGICVANSRGCPDGYDSFPFYSNYIGCGNTYSICCVLRRENRQQNCGVGSLEPSDRILNGNTAGRCDWPFVVSIRSKRTDARAATPTYFNTVHSCAGVLVERNWVLTSAFCIFSAGNSAREAPDLLLIVAGEYNISQIDRFPTDGAQQEQTFRAAEVIIHPSYAYSSASQINFNDTRALNSHSVALIRLDRSISGRCAGVQCLPTEVEANNNFLNFDECVITGWGFTRAGPFDPTAEEDGLLKVSSVRMTSPSSADFLTSRFDFQNVRPEGTTMIGPMDLNTDSCLGDEGGPVMCSTNGRWYVRGVIPFNLCLPGSFNVFVTATTFYQPWITQTINRRRGK